MTSIKVHSGKNRGRRILLSFIFICLSLFQIRCGSNNTPSRSDFDNAAAYNYDSPCSTASVKRYVQNYFINNHIPMKIEFEQNTVFIITAYDEEPKVENRTRFAAYLIQVDPDSQSGASVTFKWLVTSKGDRERTMRQTDDDKQYSPKYSSEITRQIEIFANSSCGHNDH